MKSLSRSDLRRYQVIFANLVKKLESIILAVDMGAGKTGAVLTAIVDLLDDGEITKVLIIAPLNVARATWPDEIRLWEHTRDISFTLIRAENDDDDVLDFKKDAYGTFRMIGQDAKEAVGSSGRAATQFKEWKRSRLAREDTEVHIINREALAWLWEFWGNGKNWPYDMIVTDESSMFKNGTMRTPKKGITRFGVVAKARKYTKKMVQMTGTPAPKGLINLWGQLFIADGGERLGTSKFKFESRWFDKDFMGWKIEPKPKAFADITSRIDDIMFSLPPEYYPELPKNTPLIRKVTLPRKVIDGYHDFRKKLYSTQYDIEAVNLGVLHSKLLQYANGSLYDEDGKDVPIHDEKLWALDDLYEEANGSPILVAYTFKFDLARIRKHFKKAHVWGDKPIQWTKDAWNAGDLEMLVAHGNSIGHGQNIQYGGNISIWYGLTTDLEVYQQFNKRLDRPGQTKPTFTHHILAEDTLDMKLLPILQTRKTTQQAILDVVQIEMDPI